MVYKQAETLFKWFTSHFVENTFSGKRGAKELVAALSVEKLPPYDYRACPPTFRELITAFRHCRQDRRLELASKFLSTKTSEKL